MIHLFWQVVGVVRANVSVNQVIRCAAGANGKHKPGQPSFESLYIVLTLLEAVLSIGTVRYQLEVERLDGVSCNRRCGQKKAWHDGNVFVRTCS